MFLRLIGEHQNVSGGISKYAHIYKHTHSHTHTHKHTHTHTHTHTYNIVGFPGGGEQIVAPELDPVFDDCIAELNEADLM